MMPEKDGFVPHEQALANGGEENLHLPEEASA